METDAPMKRLRNLETVGAAEHPLIVHQEWKASVWCLMDNSLVGIVDDEGTSKLWKTSYMREVILEHRLFEHINLQHGYLVNGIFRCAKEW